MDNRIKERLTGALILVAALVVLVPEIFSGRRAHEPTKDAPPAAPASEGPPLRTYTTDLDAATAPPVGQAPDAAPKTQAPATPEPPPAVAASVPPAAPPAKPAVAPEPVRAAEPAVAGDWFVQVGSFAQVANAQRYAQQLRSQGYAAIVLPPAAGKSLSRVRVGPARTREAAAALLERLAASGHKGAVVGP